MRRTQRLAIVGLLAVAIAALIWWRLDPSAHDPDRKPVGADPWAAPAGTSEAEILARKRSAHGDAPVDLAPATASGRVTRKADGSGVAGAVVTLEPDELGGSMFDDLEGSDRVVVTVADGGGAWTTSLPPGRYIATASGAGLLPASRADVALLAGARRDGIDLALEAGGATVHGTISDIFGGPIASAHVTVHVGGIAAMKSHAGGITAVSGADGGYQLTLPDGEWEARVTHLDYTPETRSLELAGKPLTVHFTLKPASTIRGTVISRADGKPVGGAIVSSHRRGAEGASATTDPQGNFTLHGVSWGTTELTARARGYASAAPTAVELGVGEQAEAVKVFVDRAFTISGFVVHAGKAAEGIAGVRVGVFSMGTKDSAMAIEPSGADGYFEILGVKPASYLAFALGGDVVPEIGKPIVVTTADVTNVLVVMETGATLSGHVEPAAIATLTIELESDKIGFGNMFDLMKAAMVTATSDPTGAFTLRNAPPGEFTLVARVKDGRIGKLKVTVTAADQTGLVIPIEARAAISGRVVDAGGAAVMGVRVKAQPLKHDSNMTMRFDDNAGALTAADGTFRVVGLEPGKVALTVSDDQGELAWADNAHDAKRPYEVDVSGVAETANLTLTVEPRDGVIRGVVTDVDNQPGADAWVTATLTPPHVDGPASHDVTITVGSSGGDMTEETSGGIGAAPPVLTSADGHFTIDHLRRGTYTVVADGAKGTTRARKAGVATGSSVALKLEPLGSLAGTVTAATAPVTDYMIECVGPTDAGSRHVIAADGAYTFERLAPGKYHCTATAESGPASGDVVIANSAMKLDLAVGAWGTLAGTVVHALTGAPLPALKVAVVGSPDGGGVESLLAGGGPTTDATGRFEIGKQPSGARHLMIFDGGTTGIHPVAERELTLAAGQHLELGTIKGVPPRSGAAGTLGLTLTSLKVDAVVAGGPAAKAGIKQGDIITAIDGHSIDELTADVAGTVIDAEHVTAGDVFKLRIARGAGTIEVTVIAEPV